MDTRPRGPVPFLLLIGGHEDRTLESRIHRELVRLAGGGASRIIVCTAATALAEIYGDVFVSLLRELGAGQVDRMDIPDRAAAGVSSCAAIDAATAVFFTGGDQRRIVAALNGTPAGNALVRRSTEGMLIAGTSAGAAIAGDLMVSGTSAPLIEPGMSFWPGMIVDQHFSQRGRLIRLLGAVGSHPGHAGVGIDEDTALLVRGSRISVIGTGQVTLVAASAPGVTPNTVTLGAGSAARSPQPRLGGAGLI